MRAYKRVRGCACRPLPTSVGLVLGEYGRRRDFPAALRASGSALKAMGLGVLVEFGCAAMASLVWMIGVIAHFTTR